MNKTRYRQTDENIKTVRRLAVMVLALESLATEFLSSQHPDHDAIYADLFDLMQRTKRLAIRLGA